MDGIMVEALHKVPNRFQVAERKGKKATRDYSQRPTPILSQADTIIVYVGYVLLGTHCIFIICELMQNNQGTKSHGGMQ